MIIKKNSYPYTARFADREIGAQNPVLVIAEIGINHEGDPSVCRDMIYAAAEAGADAVKLQTIDVSANYVEGTDSFNLFQPCEFQYETTEEMFNLAHQCGIDVFTTCGDIDTLLAIDVLAPAAHKISSGLLNHLPLIEAASNLARPLLISTGVSNGLDLEDALTVVKKSGLEDVALFQCTSLYPAPRDAVYLSAIPTLLQRYHLPVGFSDHTVGTEMAAMAVAAGACMIEKHFTLDKTRPGYDHPLSLEPEEFSEMVERIREVELMMGYRGNDYSEQVAESRLRMSRCLVANKKIQKNDLFDNSNVVVKRSFPDKRGLEPKYKKDILGKRASFDMNVGDPINEQCVANEVV